MLKHWIFISIFIFAGFFSSPSSAQGIPADEKLTNLVLYVCCYSKIALHAPSVEDARYLAVKNGTLNPITACMDLLKKATTTGTASNLKVPNTVLDSADG